MAYSCRVDTKKSNTTRKKSGALAAGILLALAVSVSASSSSDRRGLLSGASDILRKDRPYYRFGGEGQRGGYDCSSFLVEAARRGGVAELPRTSREQFDLFRRTGRIWTKGMRGWGGLLPGDIVFFSGTYSHSDDCPISHVMIYAGGGKMVGAQGSGVGYHDFDPKLPLGKPGRDSTSIRKKKTIYAYARPDWARIRSLGLAGLAREGGAARDRSERASRSGAGGGGFSEWREASHEDMRQIAEARAMAGKSGLSSSSDISVLVGGEGQELQSVRVIRPGRGIASGDGPERGVWLP
jgi:hypothetical protein